jgi:hypothetical protein
MILSRLPSIGGSFPLTSTLCLRLMNLLVGSNNTPVAVRAIKSLLTLPQISVSSEGGRQQLLHHLRFSIDYLRRAKLVDAQGVPLNLYGIAAHLYYTEPSQVYHPFDPSGKTDIPRCPGIWRSSPSSVQATSIRSAMARVWRTINRP